MLFSAIFSTLAAVLRFGWSHPVVFFGVLCGVWVGYRYALRKYRQRKAIEQYRR